MGAGRRVCGVACPLGYDGRAVDPIVCASLSYWLVYKYNFFFFYARSVLSCMRGLRISLDSARFFFMISKFPDSTRTERDSATDVDEFKSVISTSRFDVLFLTRRHNTLFFREFFYGHYIISRWENANIIQVLILIETNAKYRLFLLDSFDFRAFYLYV